MRHVLASYLKKTCPKIENEAKRRNRPKRIPLLVYSDLSDRIYNRHFRRPTFSFGNAFYLASARDSHRKTSYYEAVQDWSSIVQTRHRPFVASRKAQADSFHPIQAVEPCCNLKKMQKETIERTENRKSIHKKTKISWECNVFVTKKSKKSKFLGLGPIQASKIMLPNDCPPIKPPR